jgi:hypothetical protein
MGDHLTRVQDAKIRTLLNVTLHVPLLSSLHLQKIKGEYFEISDKEKNYSAENCVLIRRLTTILANHRAGPGGGRT